MTARAKQNRFLEVPTLHNLPQWHELAGCRGADTDLFFIERGGSSREAKRICEGCVVRGECLTFAVEHREEWGVWGGMTERERKVVRKERGLTRKRGGRSAPLV